MGTVCDQRCNAAMENERLLKGGRGVLGAGNETGRSYGGAWGQRKGVVTGRRRVEAGFALCCPGLLWGFSGSGGAFEVGELPLGWEGVTDHEGRGWRQLATPASGGGLGVGRAARLARVDLCGRGVSEGSVDRVASDTGLQVHPY